MKSAHFCLGTGTGPEIQQVLAHSSVPTHFFVRASGFFLVGGRHWKDEQRIGLGGGTAEQQVCWHFASPLHFFFSEFFRTCMSLGHLNSEHAISSSNPRQHNSRHLASPWHRLALFASMCTLPSPQMNSLQGTGSGGGGIWEQQRDWQSCSSAHIIPRVSGFVVIPAGHLNVSHLEVGGGTRLQQRDMQSSSVVHV